MGLVRPPAEGGWSPGRGDRADPQLGRMRLKEAETAQADLGRSTVAIFYEPRSHDIRVVTFDARQPYIMTDGSVLPSRRETADFLSK